MKAVVFRRTGEPREVLEWSDVPDATPGAADVLIRVEARPVHPADGFFIRGTYRWKPRFPQIAGIEGAGVIIECGPNVDSSFALNPGRRVAFRHPGTWASLASVPASHVFPVPLELTAVEACQLLLNPLTAKALLDEAGLHPGDAVLVNAAGSVVGRWLTALAKAQELRPFAVARTDRSRDRARAAGAERAFAEDEDYPSRMRELTGGAAAAFDAVGGAQGRKALDSLAPGAKFVAYGLMAAEPFPVRSEDLIYRDLRLSGFGINAWMEGRGRAEIGRDLDEITQVLRQNRSLLATRNTYPLERFREAVTDSASDKAVLLG
jgi:NADPH:quinone reductase-like Zn-dependent oxidoreductase